MADAAAPPGFPADRVHYVITVNIILACIGLVFVALRLYTRLVMMKASGLDDVFIVIGFVICVAMTALIGVQTRYHLGKSGAKLPTDPAEAGAIIKNFLRVMYGLVLTYIYACFFIKVSFVLFYRRLSRDRKYNYWVWGLIIFNVVLAITMSLPAAFSCRPIAAWWDTELLKIPGNKCINQSKLFTVNAALNVAVDFATLLLPIPMVWKSQMAMKKRIVVISLFCLGGFVCIASIIRITKLFGPSASDDPTLAAVDSHTWSMVELYAGIIAACIPTLKPLFTRIFGKSGFESSYDQKNFRSDRSGASKLKESVNYPLESVSSTKAYAGKPPASQDSLSEEELIDEKQSPTARSSNPQGIWKTREFTVQTETRV